MKTFTHKNETFSVEQLYKVRKDPLFRSDKSLLGRYVVGTRREFEDWFYLEHRKWLPLLTDPIQAKIVGIGFPQAILIELGKNVYKGHDGGGEQTESIPHDTGSCWWV